MSISAETMQAIDRWLLLIIALWFIPKGILFFTTAFLSLVLTPKANRTELGAAYRAMFFLLAPFSVLFGALFFLRWMQDRPSTVTTANMAAIGIRGVIFALMVGVTIAEIYVVRALWRRLRKRRMNDLDQSHRARGLYDVQQNDAD